MKQLKITLINPKFTKSFLPDSPPLGLCYIGAVLKKAGFFVKGYDLNFENIDKNVFKNYDVFGIYCTSPVIKNVFEISKEIKKANPKSFIIVGGPHTTAVPDQVLKNSSIDAVCIGEGEYTMKDLVFALQKNQDLSKVKGIAFKKRNIIIFNKPRPFIKNLDELPFPARDIFDKEKYPSKKRAYSTISATRGCPFRCANCKPGLDKISPYRLRSVKNVVDEIEYLMKTYNISYFMFVDSELIGPKKWVMDFCNEIKKRKLSIGFGCNGRTDQVDKEMLHTLKEVGCDLIEFGIESGSQRVIDDILCKGINIEKSKQVLKECKELSIRTLVFFMVGIPGETWKELLQTIEYAKNTDSSSILISIATPWPDTNFYYACKKNGWLISDDFSTYNERCKSVINTPFLSPEQTERGFGLFKEEIIKAGWSIESELSFYKPDKYMVLTLFKKLISLNMTKGDLNIIISSIKNKIFSIL
jgi:magnesium-protoporphyrin IX monomethyl ester (oxidative) cyclase